jgi:RimJ/RimL family protein N-acetyltransferase
MNKEFTLRPWRMEDLDSLVRYANNPNIARFLTDKFPHPYTAEGGRAFIAFANQSVPIRIFAIDIDGQASGGIGIHPQEDIYRKNAELGYWLGEPFWGQGIMSRAIGLAVAYAFEHFDIDRVFARPFGSNLASQKVLEKNHFVLEGRYHQVLIKNGIREDEMVYAIRKEKRKQDPSSVI